MDLMMEDEGRGTGVRRAGHPNNSPKITEGLHYTGAGAAGKAPPAGDLLAQILALAVSPPGETREQGDARLAAGRALQRQAAECFAAERGWRLSRRVAGLGWLVGRRGWFWNCGGCDHPWLFTTQAGRPRAIVAHLYPPLPPDLVAEAARDGLRATIMPGVSWHFPAWTVAVLYEAADVLAGTGRAP